MLKREEEINWDEVYPYDEYLTEDEFKYFTDLTDETERDYYLRRMNDYDEL